MNITAKSKKLLDRQFKSLGIATDNSVGSANWQKMFAEGAKALGNWVKDNPEETLAMAEAGYEISQSQKKSSKAGRSYRPPPTSNPKVTERNKKIRMNLNEFEGMSASMRSELIAKGIITPGAQLEAIRNSFADMLYNSPTMDSMKKSTLIFLINRMDKSIASMSE